MKKNELNNTVKKILTSTLKISLVLSLFAVHGTLPDNWVLAHIPVAIKIRAEGMLVMTLVILALSTVLHAIPILYRAYKQNNDSNI
jgi:hypothetical protein